LFAARRRISEPDIETPATWYDAADEWFGPTVDFLTV
jgi:hypothetical protein